MIPLDYSPYVVGVTGHMDLRDESIPALKARVETFFRFLLSGREQGGPSAELEELIDLLGLDSTKPKDAARLQAIRAGLEHWPAFERTPLVVLTSLAPGADTVFAEVALKLHSQGYPVHVVAPLPFAQDLYAQATTFRDSDSNAQDRKQQKYRELVAKIGVENTFCVRLNDDIELTPDEFRQRQHEDRDAEDSARRHRRYYAAGEYIAKYANWLVAIWDHEHDHETSAGTAAIVHSRLSGSRYRVLPACEGINLPNGGPVFHLSTHRQNNPSAAATTPAARLLYCETSRPPASFGDDDMMWDLSVLSITTRIAKNLEEFNRQDTPPNGGMRRELGSIMQLDDQTFVADLLKPEVLRRFQALVKVRKRAASANYPLSDKSSNTLFWLFTLSLLAAFLVHLFAEWHPQKAAAEKAHVAAPDVADADPADKDEDAGTAKPHDDKDEPDTHDVAGHAGHGAHDTHAVDKRRFFLGLSGCLAALLAMTIFWWRRAQHNGDKAYDYRAIAEGLRVQVFWNLAGLGRSVPANYMRRQRSELDWIRSVVRTASMPYEAWRDYFLELSPQQQVMLLRCVLKNWVEKQDRDYYHVKTQQHHYVMHSWHKTGGLLALTGLCGFVMLTVACWFDSHHPLGWLQHMPWLGLLLIIPMALVTFAFVKMRQSRRRTSVLEPPPHHPDLKPKTFMDRLTVRLFHLVDWVSPTTEPQSTPYLPPRDEKLRMVVNFLSSLLPAAVLAMVVATSSAIVANLWTTSPDATVWSSVLFGFCLVAGALSVAWTEKKLDSEFAYQYSTMGPLFHAAGLRLERMVSRLSELADTIEGSVDDQQAAKEEFAAKMVEAQSVLYELGTEALDENAEWLILHRARPLEPVMAG